MKRVKVYVFWVSVFACSASAAGLAAGAGSQKGRAAQVERGREVYAARCVRCHGEDGRGRTRLADIVEAPDMSDPAWQKGRGNARMIASVANGRGQMPAFKKRLSKQEIAAAVAYVRTLRR
jgi:cytochrome c oxidase cbb3-type subunit 3